MSPNFQSSFIPKDPMTEEKVFKKKKAGIVGVLSIALFVTSIVGSIGMYFYKGMVKSEIQGLESQLAEAEKNIDKKTIGEMAQFGKKLETVKSLVFKHQVVSNFLSTLSSSTVKMIQFDSFSYGDIKEGSLSVNLKGKATNYATIALQESVFSQIKYFKSMTFSNLSLNNKGLVSFDLSILVDPQIAVYAPQL
jgi:hypothetical protein